MRRPVGDSAAVPVSGDLMPAKQILVVVDPTTDEVQPVIERAAWLAKRTGAALQLFACDYDANIDARRVATVWIPEAGAREQLLLRHRRSSRSLRLLCANAG